MTQTPTHNHLSQTFSQHTPHPYTPVVITDATKTITCHHYTYGDNHGSR